jgi:aminoglycoside 2'-N-acetyltransferase I
VSSVLSPGGIRRTPNIDGALYVLPVLTPVDVTGELTCDYRPGSVW